MYWDFLLEIRQLWLLWNTHSTITVCLLKYYNVNFFNLLAPKLRLGCGVTFELGHCFMAWFVNWLEVRLGCGVTGALFHNLVCELQDSGLGQPASRTWTRGCQEETRKVRTSEAGTSTQIRWQHIHKTDPGQCWDDKQCTPTGQVYFNPFTPKSDQCQILHAASPEILHNMKNLAFHHSLRWKMISNIYYQFSLPHLYISLERLGELYILNLGVKMEGQVVEARFLRLFPICSLFPN